MRNERKTEDADLEAMLDQYRSGDPDALDALVQATRPSLYRFILGMVYKPEVAEDVFQDVWIRALRNLDGFNSRNLKAWLFRIAKNRVIDMSRKAKPDASIQQPAGEYGGTLEDFLAGSLPGPGRQSGNRDLAHRIRQAVATLPDEQREVFLWRTESELPFKEIADLQGVSINTSLARMQYALRTLRDALQEDYNDLISQTRQVLS